MNAKSKIFGFLVALALMVSMSAGATADETYPVDVELQSPTICALGPMAVTGNFGTWMWDDALGEYVLQGSSGSSMTFVSGFAPIPWAGCNVAVVFSGLNGPSGLIPASGDWFTARTLSPTFAWQSPSGWYEPALRLLGASPHYDFEFTLLDVPSYFAPGEYSGTVLLSIANVA